MKLLDATKLADAVGLSVRYVHAVKTMADSPFRGGRYCDPDVFCQWVMDHPEFRAAHAWTHPRRHLHRLHAVRSAAGRKGGRPNIPTITEPLKQSAPSLSLELAKIKKQKPKVHLTRGQLLKAWDAEHAASAAG